MTTRRHRRGLSLLIEAHGARCTAILLLMLAWVLAGLLARVGIPKVDPRADAISRPLETLGFFAVCLPLSLSLSFLRNELTWLSDVSPRPRWLLRARILLTQAVIILAGASVWFALLPADARSSHALANLLLLLDAGLVAATVMGRRLTAVGPVALVSLFSTGVIVPFEWNLLYNDARRHDAWLVALSVWSVVVCQKLVVSSIIRRR